MIARTVGNIPGLVFRLENKKKRQRKDHSLAFFHVPLLTLLDERATSEPIEPESRPTRFDAYYRESFEIGIYAVQLFNITAECSWAFVYWMEGNACCSCATFAAFRIFPRKHFIKHTLCCDVEHSVAALQRCGGRYFSKVAVKQWPKQQFNNIASLNCAQ